MNEKFALEIDPIDQIIAWKVTGDLNAEDMPKIISNIKDALSQMTRGEIRLLVDNRGMLKNSIPYVFRPEVNVFWENLMEYLFDYISKCAVLCNGPIMKMQMDRLARRTGIIKLLHHYWNEDQEKAKQEAYEFLGIDFNYLIDNSDISNIPFGGNWVLEASTTGVLVLDSHAKIIFCNEATQALTGYSSKEIYRKALDSLVAIDDVEHALNCIELVLNGQSQQFETRLVSKDGRTLMINIGLIPNIVSGTVVSIYGVVSDITEKKQAEELIKHIAFHDPLTNLPNRLMFRKRLEEDLEKAQRNNTQLAVLYLDLDGFKQVNDNHGHFYGDALLKEVAARLLNILRGSDMVARIGGDEFIVLLTNITKRDDAVIIANRILKTIESDFVIRDQVFEITTSIGISIYPFDGEKIETLIQHADAAMYRVKEEGKNNFQMFEIET